MSARRHLTVAGLLAPAVVLLVLFFAIPSIDLFRLSLAHMDAQRAIHHDVSLVNYKNFATNPYFHRMVWGSVKLTVAVTALCLLLGYPAAYFMVRVRSTLSRTILYAIVVSPLLISVIVRSYGWVVLLANNGVINGTLLSLGLIDRPLRMLGTFGSVIVATVHVLLPFMMLPIASALQSLDSVLERAAQNLGASPAQTFWRITLPLSMPGVVAGTSLVIALTLGIYITPLLVAGPLQPLFAIGIYYVTLSQLDFPLGAALSFVLLANNGVINGTLLSLGLIDRPLRMLGTFGSVIVATVHVLLPFMMLPIASALQSLDSVLERAAQNLGASPAQTFWRITLPLSMPGVVAGTSLVIALTLGIYITPLLVAGPLQPLFAIGIYYVTLSQLDFPLGAALSFVLLAFTLVVIALAGRLLKAVKGSVA